MPLLKNMTAPNGAATTFHKIVKIEVSGADMTQVTATVASWAAEADYLNGSSPLWHNYVQSTLPNVFDEVLEAVTNSETFLNASVVADEAGTLEGAVFRKNLEINEARWKANTTSFQFNGKDIACDPLSRSDIDAVQAIVSRFDALPLNFPGAWKAMDNQYVLIPDVATWDAFFGAMVATGQANFMHSQTLKSALASATTVEEVNEIHW